MPKKYSIKCQLPSNYNPMGFLRNLPSPISSEMTEIYNYSVEGFGFNFLDNMVNDKVAGQVLKLFIDEALKYSSTLEISIE